MSVAAQPAFRPFRATAGVVYLAVGVAFLLDGLKVWKVEAVYVWPLIFIAWGTAVLLGRVRRTKLEEDRTAQLAVAEERVRIARELHDIVAHSVSLMTVQIAAARRVQTSRPDEADKALLAAENTGRQSLAELRGILAMLRGADASIEAAGARRPERDGNLGGRRPLPGLADVQSLVDGAQQAGLRVELRVSGSAPEVAPSVGLVVYRVVQEALTNSMRHAPGARVQVEIAYAPDAVILFVDDDGPG
ncbi:MAG TPA: histidine kinase, partial [Acidimicrobiales bacterium]|nr:histidine kinase [Acidimicrobiales bacterium]